MWVGWRLLVWILWLMIAAAAVVASASADERVHRITAEIERLRSLQLARATTDVLEALLRPGTMAIPSRYRFTVFLFDPDANVLLPWFPHRITDVLDPKAFAPGIGAAGMAFFEDDTRLVTGDEVSSGRYGLSADQQAAFSQFRAVIATPIRSTRAVKVGVLAAIADHDDHHFEADGAEELFERLADDVGAVIERLTPHS